MDNYISYQSMASKADPKIIEKALMLRRNLRDVKSSVPTLLKNQFNFKGRKSPEIGKIIMDSLTTPEGIVLDPFIGSGSYIIAASESNKTFYGSELDNYTFDVVNTYFQPADLDLLFTLFNQVKEQCFEQIRSLYETRCCNSKNYIKKLHFDPETNNYYNPKPHRDIKNGKNIILLHKCPVCGSTTKKFDAFDEEKIKALEKCDVSKFPSHDLIENSRINITKGTGADKYDTNFTTRNKVALLKLQEAISSLADCHEKHLLQHFLVASLTLSRIAQYGSGSEYIYQVMREQAQEMNVWYLFEERYNKFKQFYKKYVESKNEWFKNKFTFVNSDYNEFMSSTFKGVKKVDLILTDPPYHDQVPYLERNQLYRDWLYQFVDIEKYALKDELLEKEIVVSNAPTRKRNKNYENHVKDINKMFLTFSNSIKTGGFVVLAVNLGQKKYFDLLSQYILKARKNGFEYITRIDKTITDPTLRKQAAFKSTLSKEMYLIFTKLPEEKKYWFIGDKNIEFEIKKFVYKKIQESSSPYSLSKLIIDIESEIIKNRTSPNSPQQVKIMHIIKDNFKIDFKQHIYLDENKLYVDLEDSETLFVKLYDIIPVIIENLLVKQNDFFVLEDIYFEISDKLCNGDPGLLEKIIDSNSKEADINNLILNFCEETERGYIRKQSYTNQNGENLIDLRTIDPYGLEELIKQLLIKEGYINVARMGGAGDRGVDIVATKLNIRTNKHEKYIFQVKRWIGNVGSEPIQRLNSVKITDGFDYGICVTTSDYTQAGLQEGKLTGVELLNGSDLLELLSKHYPNQYFISEIN
ncbi:restriction endonuclease [Bacillus kwashiorkori]|uniref:restriction endonuclease n=1 Tax=Bacillus kwashiorkori TaxID=1522318 RepID=UPI00078524C0|nr:restriction endonuclease [Bacillus kwashiorkori]